MKFIVFLLVVIPLTLFSQNPSSIPDLKLWLSADSGVVSSSNLVTQWGDISTNGFDLSQMDLSKCPILVSNVNELNKY